MENHGQAKPSAGRFARRNPLRQATFIVPTTGQRIKRDVTLRDPAIFGSSSQGANGNDAGYGGEGEQAPLLPKPGLASTQPRSHWLYQRIKDGVTQFWKMSQTETGHNIIKCSLAYLLASLATFSAPLSSLLGTHWDGNQVVANIVVWFDPARTAGSMVLGVMLGFLAFLYGFVIDFASQAVSLFFSYHKLPVVGHVIVLLVFCWGGLGLLAWFKQHLGHPQINTACSLSSLVLVTTLVKEGSVQAGDFSYYRILQMLKMLIMGILITTLVNLILWPTSARKKLLNTLVKTSEAFGKSLTTVAACFLSGSEDDLSNPAVLAASDRLKDSFNSLPKHLAEARYEHFVLGTERQYYIEMRLVECMQQLAQNLGGLKSAAATQFALLSEGKGLKSTLLSTEFTPRPSLAISPLNTRTRATIGSNGTSGATDVEADEDAEDLSDLELQRTVTAQTPANIFDTFIMQLGPPMKSMAWTMKEVLKALPVASESSRDHGNLARFRNSLGDAIDLFKGSRRDALDSVYRSKELSKKLSMEVAADFEEVAASCGHFSGSLEDFAEDCMRYLDILDELELEICERPHGRTWNWLLFWKHDRPGYDDAELSGMGYEEAALTSNTGNISDIRQEQHLEQEKESSSGFPYRFYPYFRLFRREDIKFAIKVGAGATLNALFAFIPATESYFRHWHLEWGLISYMLVCSTSIGASNTTAWSRSYGTFLGAVIAIIAWVISHKNPYALAACGWVVSLGSFYFIVAKKQGPMGRFTLLAYNISVLYSFALAVGDPDADGDEDEGGGGIDPQIFEIAFHRFFAVMIGVLGGVFITYYVWPISAREKVKTGVSLLWLRMGLMWKRSPLHILLDSDDAFPSYMDIRTETKLRDYVGTLDTLRKSAESEFKMRGPFPTERFDKIIKSTTRMLDAFHALKTVVVESLRHPNPAKMELLRYTANECDAVALRLCHLLSVLASSMNMEYPLTDALPPTAHVRDRLLAKVFEFRQTDKKQNNPTDEDYELLYCYALVTGGIATEIDACGKELEKLYRNLGEKVLKLQ